MSPLPGRRYLIAYDIVDDKRRTAVAKKLESYGDRIQYSVFVVDMTRARLVRLNEEIQTRMDVAVDSVLFCDLGPIDVAEQRTMTYLGRQRPTTEWGPLLR